MFFDPKRDREPQPGQAAPAYQMPAAGGAPATAWQPPGPPMGATGAGAPINWGALAQSFQQRPQAAPQAPAGPGPGFRMPWQPGAGAPQQAAPWMQGPIGQLAQRLAQRRQQWMQDRHQGGGIVPRSRQPRQET